MKIGEELIGKTFKVTEEKLVAFERVIWHRVANVHSDKEVAKKVGMSKTIASGQNQLAFLHHLMESNFGDGWIRGGKIAARWVCPVYIGDESTPCAKVQNLTELGGRKVAEMEIWCTNQGGVKTALGTAQAYLQ